MRIYPLTSAKVGIYLISAITTAICSTSSIFWISGAKEISVAMPLYRSRRTDGSSSQVPDTTNSPRSASATSRATTKSPQSVTHRVGPSETAQTYRCTFSYFVRPPRIRRCVGRCVFAASERSDSGESPPISSRRSSVTWSRSSAARSKSSP